MSEEVGGAEAVLIPDFLSARLLLSRSNKIGVPLYLKIYFITCLY
jgi:hypothetical protein